MTTLAGLPPELQVMIVRLLVPSQEDRDPRYRLESTYRLSELAGLSSVWKASVVSVLEKEVDRNTQLLEAAREVKDEAQDKLSRSIKASERAWLSLHIDLLEIHLAWISEKKLGM